MARKIGTSEEEEFEAALAAASGPPSAASAARSAKAAKPKSSPSSSDKDEDVEALLSEGKTDAQIARATGLSVADVKLARSNMLSEVSDSLDFGDRRKMFSNHLLAQSGNVKRLKKIYDIAMSSRIEDPRVMTAAIAAAKSMADINAATFKTGVDIGLIPKTDAESAKGDLSDPAYLAAELKRLHQEHELLKSEEADGQVFADLDDPIVGGLSPSYNPKPAGTPGEASSTLTLVDSE